MHAHLPARMHVRVCMHARMLAHLCAHTHIHSCPCIQNYEQARVHTHTLAHTHTHAHTHRCSSTLIGFPVYHKTVLIQQDFLVKEGMAWVDDQAGAERLYWFPSLFPAASAS